MVVRWGMVLPAEPIADADIYAIASTLPDFPQWITPDMPIRRCEMDHGASVYCTWSRNADNWRVA